MFRSQQAPSQPSSTSTSSLTVRHSPQTSCNSLVLCFDLLIDTNDACQALRRDTLTVVHAPPPLSSSTDSLGPVQQTTVIIHSVSRWARLSSSSSRPTGPTRTRTRKMAHAAVSPDCLPHFPVVGCTSKCSVHSHKVHHPMPTTPGPPPSHESH